jgi:hypothetical protein
MAHAFDKEASEPEFGRVRVQAVSVGIQGIEMSMRAGTKASFAVLTGS